MAASHHTEDRQRRRFCPTCRRSPRPRRRCRRLYATVALTLSCAGLVGYIATVESLWCKPLNLTTSTPAKVVEVVESVGHVLLFLFARGDIPSLYSVLITAMTVSSIIFWRRSGCLPCSNLALPRVGGARSDLWLWPCLSSPLSPGWVANWGMRPCHLVAFPSVSGGGRGGDSHGMAVDRGETTGCSHREGGMMSVREERWLRGDGDCRLLVMTGTTMASLWVRLPGPRVRMAAVVS